ncbi:hypothetical protein URH17368_0929 [Alicyclobacillus hesperidum URH17-3-68]|nr:hypothetical protein URH17368_0929 [Alicyclobacillus hesperidum URH17-3-68]
MEVRAVMLSMLMFLPRLFRYFGMFQTFVGIVRPVWPFLSRFWSRQPATATA